MSEAGEMGMSQEPKPKKKPRHHKILGNLLEKLRPKSKYKDRRTVIDDAKEEKYK